MFATNYEEVKQLMGQRVAITILGHVFKPVGRFIPLDLGDGIYYEARILLEGGAIQEFFLYTDGDAVRLVEMCWPGSGPGFTHNWTLLEGEHPYNGDDEA